MRPTCLAPAPPDSSPRRGLAMENHPSAPRWPVLRLGGRLRRNPALCLLDWAYHIMPRLADGGKPHGFQTDPLPPAAIQRFDPVHHPVQILADGLITAPQFAQRSQSVFPVIDRPHHSRAQQVGQLARVYLVAFVAFL